MCMCKTASMSSYSRLYREPTRKIYLKANYQKNDVSHKKISFVFDLWTLDFVFHFVLDTWKHRIKFIAHL